jgi:aspartate carbamoyltransferase catalytic subunit
METADIIYMTRIQRERFSDPIEYEKVKNAYILTADMLTNCKPNMRVLHPLPRVNEITEDVDSHLRHITSHKHSTECM